MLTGVTDAQHPLEFADDPAPAEWVVDGLVGFGENVGSVVPHGFDAYARLLHPAALAGQPVSWSDIAHANGKTMHAEAQFERISGVDPWHSTQPGIWDAPPTIGHLPGTTRHDVHDLATPLVDALASNTRTPERVWFCVWEGWGGMQRPGGEPPVRLPGRKYWLMRGPIAAAVCSLDEIGADGPSIWWPDDRAWCVATEIDFRWTYIGGSQSLVDRLVDDPRFEALQAAISDEVQVVGDRVNT